MWIDGYGFVARTLARVHGHGVAGFIKFDNHIEFCPLFLEHLSAIRLLVSQAMDAFEFARFFAELCECAENWKQIRRVREIYGEGAHRPFGDLNARLSS